MISDSHCVEASTFAAHCPLWSEAGECPAVCWRTIPTGSQCCFTSLSVRLLRSFCGLMQWTSGAYPESWTFSGTSLSEMMASVALPTSHHFHPSLSPVVSLTLGILHEWMRRQMLAKPSSNLLQRFGGNHQGGRAQVGWRTFMMTCLCWILGYMRIEIWHKIGLSGDWCLCTVLLTHSCACYYWIGCCLPHLAH